MSLYESSEAFYHYNVPERSYYIYGPFHLATSLMSVVLIVLALLSIFFAMLYLADFVEDNPTLSRKVLRISVLVNVVIHVLIMVIDRLSWWRSVLSIVLNVIYSRILRSFPFIPSTSRPILWLAAVGAVAESVSWYILFWSMATTTVTLMGFFGLLWLLPLVFLSTCTLESNELPGAKRFDSSRDG